MNLERICGSHLHPAMRSGPAIVSTDMAAADGRPVDPETKSDTRLGAAGAHEES
jgi:hypothetical protein